MFLCPFALATFIVAVLSVRRDKSETADVVQSDDGDKLSGQLTVTSAAMAVTYSNWASANMTAGKTDVAPTAASSTLKSSGATPAWLKSLKSYFASARPDWQTFPQSHLLTFSAEKAKQDDAKKEGSSIDVRVVRIDPVKLKTMEELKTDPEKSKNTHHALVFGQNTQEIWTQLGGYLFFSPRKASDLNKDRKLTQEGAAPITGVIDLFKDSMPVVLKLKSGKYANAGYARIVDGSSRYLDFRIYAILDVKNPRIYEGLNKDESSEAKQDIEKKFKALKGSMDSLNFFLQPIATSKIQFNIPMV